MAKIKETKIFWVDLETSGLNPQKNGIIQLAYIIDIAGKEKEKGVLYSNAAGYEIVPEALAVSKTTIEDLSRPEYTHPKELYISAKTLLSKYVNPFDKEDKFFIAGYNVAFDINFLRELWLQYNDKFFNSWFHFGALEVSTILRFAQDCQLLELQTNAKLFLVAKLLGIELKEEELHNALADISLTKDVYLKLKELIRGKN